MKRQIDRMLAVCILLVMGTILPLAGADNMQRIIPVGAPEFETIRLLYVEAGLSPPSATGPWSTGELLGMVDRLEGRRLSQAGTQARERVRAALLREAAAGYQLEDSVLLRPGMELALETYLHTD